jgi:hypothetical protein
MMQVFSKRIYKVMETKSKNPVSTKQESHRAERMAKALRENLLKRKQQQRDRLSTSNEEKETKS